MAKLEFDHVGVVVDDLEATAQFFVALGFQREEPFEVGGAWVDRIIGLEGARVEGMFVAPPDGSGKLELVKFHEPTRARDQEALPADAYGYRHIAYRVTDIAAVVAQAREAGYETVGDVVDYQDVYRLAYIRGPEGLIVEVAQPLSSGSSD